MGAYEAALIRGPNGEDYGTDRSVIAALDFALDLPDGEAPQPLADPPEARLKLVEAELGGALGEDDGRTDRSRAVGGGIGGKPETAPGMSC